MLWIVEVNSTNPDRDKDAPDEEKYKLLRTMQLHGGTEWRQWWDAVQPRARCPRSHDPGRSGVESTRVRPASLRPPLSSAQWRWGRIICRRLERRIDRQSVDFEVAGKRFDGDIPGEKRACLVVDPETNQRHTLSF